MATIRGRVVSEQGIGVPNISVELWPTDQKGKTTGGEPFLSTITKFGGAFHIDTTRFPADAKLPEKCALVFSDRAGHSLGRDTLTDAMRQGEATDFPLSAAEPTTQFSMWPDDYSPMKLIPPEVKSELKLAAGSGLPMENAPEVSHFNTYVYLSPVWQGWPWPVQPGDFPDVPDLRQPFLLGVQVLHRQEWRLAGHARGELLHSLPLAPGEETTIEILTWDRNVYKREEEIVSDLEREVEENRQFKDSQEVMRKMQENKQWKVGGGFGLNLGFIKFDAGGGYEAQSETIDSDTRNTVVESTERAATTLHDQRKTLISSTREFGREEKVSRKIANTNRCHTVTYHFYEVLRNYEISTAIAPPAARPCIFVKQAPPIERSVLVAQPYDYDTFLSALEWLHLNSHVIARRLLDRSLYGSLDVLPDVLAYWRLRRGVATTGLDYDPMLRPWVRQLISRADEVQSCTPQSNPEAWAVRVCVVDHAPWLLPSILDSQDSLKSTLDHPDPNKKNELLEKVKNFLEMWNTRYPLIPESCRETIELPRIRVWMFEPVMQLKQEYAKLVYGPAPGEEPTPESIGRMREVSSVMRLLRHIEQNYLYYFQLIWAAKDISQLLVEATDVQLPGGGDVRLADVISSELLGFYAHYAVFPFTEVEEGSELAQLVEAFQARLSEPSLQSEAVLPTNGVVVEPQLSEYTACEPFIEEHRIHDLRQKELEVDRAAIENHRRSRKIQNCELDNPECCPSRKYGFLQRLLCWIRGNTGD